MIVVEVDPEGDLAGRAQLLFASDAYANGKGTFDVSADGERFVMIGMSEAPQPPTERVLVRNWADEPKRLVPTKLRRARNPGNIVAIDDTIVMPYY